MGCAGQDDGAEIVGAKGAWLLAVLLALGLMTAWTIYLVHRYGVDIPFADEWRFVPIYVAIKDGAFSLWSITRQQNEHRIFVSLAIISLNAWATDWNAIYTLTLGVILEAAAAVMLIGLAYRSVGERAMVFGLCGLVIVAQTFNMAQFVNWIWEWDLCWHLANFCAVAMVFSLHRAANSGAPILPICLAITSAFLGTFSLGSCLALWPIGLLYLVVEPSLRRYALLWIAVAGWTCTIYFVGYYFVPLPPVNMAPVDRLITTAEFVGRFLGSTLTSGYLGGVVAIAMAALATAWCLLRAERRRLALPWICLALFAGGGALLAGLARVPFSGAGEGGATRYSTIALLFAIASCLLTVIALRRVSPWLQAAVPAAFLVASIAHYPDGYGWLLRNDNRLVAGRACLYTDINNTKCLEDLYAPGAAEDVRGFWRELQRVGWSGAR